MVEDGQSVQGLRGCMNEGKKLIHQVFSLRRNSTPIQLFPSFFCHLILAVFLRDKTQRLFKGISFLAYSIHTVFLHRQDSMAI